MISVNHSCGLLGVDCGNTHRRLTDRCTSVFHLGMRYVSVILFAHKFVLKARSSWGGPNRAESALANRTCKSNLHGTSSYDSWPRLRRSRRPDLFVAFPFLSFSLRISAARRFVFSRWDRRGGITENPSSHARTRTCGYRRVSRLYFRNCSVVPLDAP